MSKSALTAKKRDNSKNPRQLRSSGKLPATLYGKDTESISLELDAKEFAIAYKKDKNAIFTLSIDKDSYDSIVKKVQRETLKDSLLNVEFQRIRSDATVKMIVPLEIVGVSPAVKAGGTLSSDLTEIEVECLPANIPSIIQVDISVLENLDESITLADVKYPQGVQPTGTPETPVLRVSAPTSAEPEVSEEEGAEAVAATAEEAAKE